MRIARRATFADQDEAWLALLSPSSWQGGPPDAPIRSRWRPALTQDDVAARCHRATRRGGASRRIAQFLNSHDLKRKSAARQMECPGVDGSIEGPGWEYEKSPRGGGPTSRAHLWWSLAQGERVAGRGRRVLVGRGRVRGLGAGLASGTSGCRAWRRNPGACAHDPGLRPWYTQGPFLWSAGTTTLGEAARRRASLGASRLGCPVLRAHGRLLLSFAHEASYAARALRESVPQPQLRWGARTDAGHYFLAVRQEVAERGTRPWRVKDLERTRRRLRQVPGRSLRSLFSPKRPRPQASHSLSGCDQERAARLALHHPRARVEPRRVRRDGRRWG